MNNVKSFPVYLKNNFNLNSFSALILDYLEIGITYKLLVKFIYYEPALNAIYLDRLIIFKIPESNSKKSLNNLYNFLHQKIGDYNKNYTKEFNGEYKSIQAEALEITYQIRD